jgi:hypothetical protein
MPLTGVMAWELWLREPGRKWQFFLITQHGVVEVLTDETIFFRPVLPAGILPGRMRPKTGEKNSPEETGFHVG